MEEATPEGTRRAEPAPPLAAATPERVHSRPSDEVRFAIALRRATPRAWVTPTLLGANLLVFVAMAAAGVSPLSPSVDDLLAWGANHGPAVAGGEPWRLLTCMFVHGGLLHLAFNLWILRDLGSLVERVLGNVGFLILYVVSGLVASLASAWWDPWVVSVGASGAIFGVLGALLALFARERDEIPSSVIRPIRNSSLAFLGYNIVFGLSVPFVDMAAHLGGLAAGFLGGLVLGHRRLLADTGPRTRRNAVLLVGGLAVVIGGVLALPQDEVRAREHWQHFGTVEERCLERFRTAATRYDAGELSSEAFAAEIRDEILPAWREARGRLESIEDAPGPAQEFLEDALRYVALRQEAWELFERSLSEDDALLEQRAGARWSAADRLAKELADD